MWRPPHAPTRRTSRTTAAILALSIFTLAVRGAEAQVGEPTPSGDPGELDPSAWVEAETHVAEPTPSGAPADEVRVAEEEPPDAHEPLTELAAFAAHPPPGLAEALFAEDRDEALALLEGAPPTRATACVEATLRDQALRARYLPSRPPVDALSTELFEITRAEWVAVLASAARAYARCIAGASGLTDVEVVAARRGGSATVRLQALKTTMESRSVEISRAARDAASSDAFEAHAAIARILRDTSDEAATTPWSWDAAVAFYVAEQGRLPLPDEPKREPEWRVTPLLVGAIELSLALALVPASFRADGIDDARVRLSLAGLALGGFVAMILAPTWSERGRRDRLISSGLLLAASMALGLGTALADVPRLRAFGAALTASSIVNLGLWSGGAVVQRRWRPLASVSRHHGALGCRVLF